MDGEKVGRYLYPARPLIEEHFFVAGHGLGKAEQGRLQPVKASLKSGRGGVSG